MAAILTTPIAVAAIVLGVAGVAKLRSPAGALRALTGAGLSVPTAALRILAAGELALAALVLVVPGRAECALLASIYALLALVAAALSRRGAVCGCFGEGDVPASAAQATLSSILALIATAGVVWPMHGIASLFEGAPAVVGVRALGIAGGAYATVLVYTELPSAWSAWRPR